MFRNAELLGADWQLAESFGGGLGRRSRLCASARNSAVLMGFERFSAADYIYFTSYRSAYIEIASDIEFARYLCVTGDR